MVHVRCDVSPISIKIINKSNLHLRDLDRAPYMLYGVTYIGLVSLTPLGRASYVLHCLVSYPMYALQVRLRGGDQRQDGQPCHQEQHDDQVLLRFRSRVRPLKLPPPLVTAPVSYRALSYHARRCHATKNNMMAEYYFAFDPLHAPLTPTWNCAIRIDPLS